MSESDDSKKNPYEYTSQPLPANAVIHAMVVKGPGCFGINILQTGDFDTTISNPNPGDGSHADVLKKLPSMKKGFDAGKIARHDVETPGFSPLGLQVIAYYFRTTPGKDSASPRTEGETASNGTQGTLAGTQGTPTEVKTSEDKPASKKK